MRVLVICVVVLAIFCFLIPSAWLVFRRLPEDIGHEIESRLSDQQVVEEADRDLGKRERDLRKLYTKVYLAKDRMEELQPKVGSARSELAKREEILKRSRELLKENQPGSTIVIGGAKHTWDYLQEDASNHVQYCQALKDQIQSGEKSLSDYAQAYAHGNQVIDAEMQKIKRERIQINLDAVILAAGRARQEAKALDNDIAGLKPISGSGRYHQLLKERVREVKADDEFDRRSDTARASKIAWDKELGTSQTAVETINAYFGDTKPATAPAHR